MRITKYSKEDHQFGNQWFDETLDHWDYDDYKKDPDWSRKWISFNCAALSCDKKQILLGVTSFASDIFSIFDLDSKRFLSTGIAKIADSFDAKFHRSLVYRKSDACYYAAIALLHNCDHYFDAPGGAIVRYNPVTKELKKISIPIPHVYIQAIVLDAGEENIFGQCFAPEYAFKYNISSGKTTVLGLLGSGYDGLAQGENIVRDKKGDIWFNWSLTRAWQSSPGIDARRLCKYDACNEKMIFYPTGLPLADGSYGFAKVEAFMNLGDDFIYAGGNNGALYRINPQTGVASLVNSMIQDRPSRLSSMVAIGNGSAMGITGRNGNCQLFRFTMSSNKVEIIGDIVDESGVHLWQCHDLVMVNDKLLYVCENDNPHRSGYLWEIEL